LRDINAHAAHTKRSFDRDLATPLSTRYSWRHPKGNGVLVVDLTP